jgi:hypothetical protein
MHHIRQRGIKFQMNLGHSASENHQSTSLLSTIIAKKKKKQGAPCSEDSYKNSQKLLPISNLSLFF